MSLGRLGAVLGRLGDVLGGSWRRLGVDSGGPGAILRGISAFGKRYKRISENLGKPKESPGFSRILVSRKFDVKTVYLLRDFKLILGI